MGIKKTGRGSPGRPMTPRWSWWRGRWSRRRSRTSRRLQPSHRLHEIGLGTDEEGNGPKPAPHYLGHQSRSTISCAISSNSEYLGIWMIPASYFFTLLMIASVGSGMS